jgi:hypothetical protein
MPSTAIFITGLLSALLSPAQATEVVWDGHYRARGEIFDSLSLSETNPNAEGAAWHMDHRFRLRPGFRITDRVAVFTQVDVLPYVKWGSQPVMVPDPFTGEAQPVVYSDAVGPPTTDAGGVTPQNLQVTRLWGEVQTDWGLFRFGRVPNHWGAGMVFNAGNRPIDEYGDTVDRLQFTGKAGPVYLMGGLENRYEGLAADRDDYRAVVGSILYENEKAGLGFLSTYRWKGEVENRYRVFIADLWAKANLGIAEAELEFAAVAGRGDLDGGLNDISQRSFGGHLRVDIDPGSIRAGVLGGFATGDADRTDSTIKTFSYDPDFNVSLFLFEETMPTLTPPANTIDDDGRTTTAGRTGPMISDALFFKPSIGWRFNDDLFVDVSWMGARRAKKLEDEEPGYGSEIDAHVRYDPFPHFWVQLTGGVFLPGKIFTEYEDIDLGGDFDKPALGARLLTTIEF